MEELFIEDTTICPFCGSTQKRDGCSLHVWDIEYECGCVIVGAISDKGIALYKECPNRKENEKN